MVKLVYRYDDEGYYIEPVICDTETCENTTPVEPPNYYRARWTGKTWVEGISNKDLLVIQKQQQAHHLEGLLQERYQAHGKLLATDADPAEIEEVKDEIALILEELGGLYNATTT